jgi:hypothetical protein
MKEQLTVRLDPEVLKAARDKAQRENVSVSAVVADAAARALLHAGHAEWEAGILRALDRLGNKVDKLDKRTGYDAGVLKEMVGLFVRAYFNHTPALPEPALRPALLSGKERFARFMDTLAANLGRGTSVLREVGAPSPDESIAASVKESVALPAPATVPAAPATPPSDPEERVQDGPPEPQAPLETAVASPNADERPSPSAAGKRRWGLF